MNFIILLSRIYFFLSKTILNDYQDKKENSSVEFIQYE